VCGWCGQAGRERFDELTALRKEVVRLGLLVEAAVTALHDAGAQKAADRIERELGVPLEVVRAPGAAALAAKPCSCGGRGLVKATR
jgi:hypothetical protein